MLEPAIDTGVLTTHRARVFIVDINISDAQSFADDLNQKTPDTAFAAKCDVSSWDDLSSTFTQALDKFDRIDYVFPIAGLTERAAISKPSEQKDVRKNGFQKPDLTVFDVNANGMITLILMAVQAFRGQDQKDELGGMRGKSEFYLFNQPRRRVPNLNYLSRVRSKHMRPIRHHRCTSLHCFETVSHLASLP